MREDAQHAVHQALAHVAYVGAPMRVHGIGARQQPSQQLRQHPGAPLIVAVAAALAMHMHVHMMRGSG